MTCRSCRYAVRAVAVSTGISAPAYPGKCVIAFREHIMTVQMTVLPSARLSSKVLGRKMINIFARVNIIRVIGALKVILTAMSFLIPQMRICTRIQSVMMPLALSRCKVVRNAVEQSVWMERCVLVMHGLIRVNGAAQENVFLPVVLSLMGSGAMQNRFV